MPINGKIGSLTVGSDCAQIPGKVIVRTAQLKADDGLYPAGLLLTRKNGVMQQLQLVDAEALATGDGATTEFSATLAATPVQPGNVVIGDGVETFKDDGLGRLVGDQGGTGQVYYDSGKISLTFAAAPAAAADIAADYMTAVSGVLDVAEDTAQSEACEYVARGLVQGASLKVEVEAQAVPTEEILLHLEAAGIFAV